MKEQGKVSFAGPIGYYTTNQCGEERQLQLTVVVNSEAKAAWVDDMVASLRLVGTKPDVILIEHRNARYDGQTGRIVYAS
jgi:hypothetical protein